MRLKVIYYYGDEIKGDKKGRARMLHSVDDKYYTSLIGKPEEARPLGKPMYR
jgi:hypothetical protein